MGWKQNGEAVDPNDLVNLISLCRSCHQKKTGAIEYLLFSGNVAAFIEAMTGFIPKDRLDAVLALYGLTANRKITVAKCWTREKKNMKGKATPTIRGEKHWGARLTLAQVEDMIRRQGEDRNRLAGEYGISRRYLSQIIRGFKWSWVPRPPDFVAGLIP